MPPSPIELLFPAARAACRPDHLARLRETAADFNAWDALPEFAEQQRMAPLFSTHARAAGLALPDAARLALQGLYLRSRQANQVRARLLAEILPACAAEGIQVVLLKGAALFCLVYPDPALRPMRDIDLLARPDQARRLHRLLIELGFQVTPAEPGKPASARHLPELYRQQPGLRVSLEVHDGLFDPTWRVRPPRIEEWIERARPFALNGVPAFTLNLEDMLWHTYQHMINEEIRLAAVADMISLCEQFAGEIDWPRVRRCCPALLGALSLFHALSPLDERLVLAAGIPRPRRAVPPGPDRSGWPVIPLSQARTVGLGRFLRQALCPGEWWLRLFYGLSPERALWPYRWLRYPLELLRLAAAHVRMHLQRIQKQRV